MFVVARIMIAGGEIAEKLPAGYRKFFVVHVVGFDYTAKHLAAAI